VDELTAFDRRLGRSALDRAGATGDVELAAILQQVAARRTARRASCPTEPVHEVTGSGAPDQVHSVEELASSVRIIRTGRPAGFTFRAGQYVKLGVPGGKRASFSIASAPHEPHLEFCIELMPDGRVTPALFRQRPGDRVDVPNSAKGSFTLDPTSSSHLMVATTTGIAPLRSMLRDALHRGERGDFLVLHGASYADELPYRAELTALAESAAQVVYRPTVSRPTESRNAGWRGETGRVDDLALQVAAGLSPTGTRVYACGNSQMIDRVRSELAPRGFAVSTEKYD
jgi:NAD(P)H-flavin reductase